MVSVKEEMDLFKGEQIMNKYVFIFVIVFGLNGWSQTAREKTPCEKYEEMSLQMQTVPREEIDGFKYLPRRQLLSDSALAAYQEERSHDKLKTFLHGRNGYYRTRDPRQDEAYVWLQLNKASSVVCQWITDDEHTGTQKMPPKKKLSESVVRVYKNFLDAQQALKENPTSPALRPSGKGGR